MQTGHHGMILVEKQYVKPSNKLEVDGLPFETFIGHYCNDDDRDQHGKNSACQTKKRNKARIIIISVWLLLKEAEAGKLYCELMMLFTP